MQWVIGIDEAGRGPLAGPMSIGAVALPLNENDWKFWQGLKDSKKLSEKKREEWFAHIHAKQIKYAVTLVSAAVIDEVGLTRAAQQGTHDSISRLGIGSKNTHVLLDWGLSVSVEWKQTQYVKGDENIPVIALASIVAKVTRDHHMLGLAKDFPAYGFEKHKGYGTRDHYEALKEHGLCTEHRRSFL